MKLVLWKDEKKIDKPLVRLMKKKREGTNNQCQEQKRRMATDPVHIYTKTRGYYEQLCQ